DYYCQSPDSSDVHVLF
nr:immunoglobulin light chain junction region [Macaca mulatta]MOW27643.1 immunoglobulin light chain junction region [Macaca mulatta]MOW27692.1 immunoglobulin light chain junction region [Macaca mulatta]MOW27864.1 immunoglobulin light chain junction region [Macaca mulatta]MOW28439.1 immunoglobulin light chain junction region [Macaca mulatta]